MSQLQRVAIAPSQLHQQWISLTADQLHYLSHVLRLKAGDRFIALDGTGHGWLSELQDHDTAQIIQLLEVQTELSTAVTLLVALPKGSGFDEVVRQVTELGVRTIIPLLSDRTLLNPSPSRIERWRRIAREAAEQSERLVVPEIQDPLALGPALQLSANHRYFCVTRYPARLLWSQLQEDLSQPSDPTSIQVAIGPEGGWTEAEVEQAIAAGYQPVSLGQRILRTVTAPLSAMSLIAATLEAREQMKGSATLRKDPSATI